MAKKLKAKYHAAKAGLKKHGKNFMVNAKQPAMQIGLATAGVIGTQKFLDFKTLMKDQYAKNPDAIYFKHEGLIKVGAAIVTVAMWKNMPEWAKWLVIGVGIQGGIVAVRQYTKDKASGESLVSQIGTAEYESAINSLAAEIKSVAERERTSVGEIEDNMRGTNEMLLNSATGVGSVQGMGTDMSMSY